MTLEDLLKQQEVVRNHF